MTKDEIEKYLEDLHPDGEFILADGFEEAFVGTAIRFGITDPVTLYDYELCIGILMLQGMSRLDAIEHFDFNVIGSWNGDLTPIFSILTPDIIKKIVDSGPPS